MNKQYKLKFNTTTLSLDAVSELANNAVSYKAAASTSTSGSKSLSSNSSFNSKPYSFKKLTFFVISAVATAKSSLAYADSLRSGMTVVAGQAQVQTQGALTQITTQGNTILNWEKFGINTQEVLKFIQASSNNAVLNRVLGGEVTKILGQLQSNGKVFIVNPAGVVFGKEAIVDTAGLVASTLNINDEDFLQGKYVFSQEKDHALARVINRGMLKVNANGTLTLIGGQVANYGTLEAKNGTVYLLSGKEITIQDLDNPLISYKVSAGNKAVNLGTIVARKAMLLANKVAHGITAAQDFTELMSSEGSATQVCISADSVTLYGASVSEKAQRTDASEAEIASINRSGLTVVNATINTSKPTGKGGTVNLLGDVVVLENHAQVLASGKQGGAIAIGGDYQGQGKVKLANVTSVLPGAVVDVSGHEQDAGQAIVWGNTAYVSGTFLATSEKGTGGFIETSGKNLNILDVEVKAKSTYGKAGSWLLDPTNIFILNASESKAQYGTELSPSGKNYSAQNGNGNSYITYAKLNSTISGNQVRVILRATHNITFQEGELQAKNNSLEAYAQNITLKDARISGAYDFYLIATNNVTVTNSTVKVAYVKFQANNYLSIGKSTITTTGAERGYYQANNQFIGNGINIFDNTTFDMKTSTNITSKEKSICVTDSTLKMEGYTFAGGIVLAATNNGNITVENSTIRVGNGLLNLLQTANKNDTFINISNSTLRSWSTNLRSGGFTINQKNSAAKGYLVITNSTVASYRNITFRSSNNGNQKGNTTVIFNESNISANGRIWLWSGDGPSSKGIILNNSNLTSKDQFEINSYQSNTSFTNSNLTATNNYIQIRSVHSTSESSRVVSNTNNVDWVNSQSITLNATTVNSKSAKIVLTSSNSQISLNGTSLVAFNPTEVTAKNKIEAINGSVIYSEKTTKVQSTNQNIRVENSSVVGWSGVNIYANQSKFEAIESNITGNSSSTADLNLIAKSEVNFSNSNIANFRNAIVKSNSSTINLNGFSHKGTRWRSSLTVVANKQITVNGSTFDSGAIYLNSTTQGVNLTNSTLTAKSLALNALGTTAAFAPVYLDNVNASINWDINFYARSGEISVINSSLTTNFNFSANSAAGNVNFSNSTISANVNFDVDAYKSVYTNKEVNLGGSQTLSLVAATGSLELDNTTLGRTCSTLATKNATNGNINLTCVTLSGGSFNITSAKALKFVTVTGSGLSDLNFNSTDTLNVKNSSLASTGNTALLAVKALTITQGSKLSSNNLTLNSKDTATVTDSNLSTSYNQGQFDFSASKAVSLNNSNFAAAHDLRVVSAASLSVTCSSFTSQANATFSAPTVTFTQSKAAVTGSLVVNATTNALSFLQSNFSVQGNLDVDAKQALTANNSNFSALGTGATSFVSNQGGITLYNSSLEATNATVATANKANGLVNITESKLSGIQLNLTSAGVLNFSQSSINAQLFPLATPVSATSSTTQAATANVQLHAADKLNVKNSALASNASLSLSSAKQVTLTSTKVKGTEVVTTGAAVVLDNSNFAASGTLTLNATATALSSIHSNFSANNIDVDAKQQVSLAQSNLTATAALSVVSHNSEVTLNEAVINAAATIIATLPGAIGGVTVTRSEIKGASLNITSANQITFNAAVLSAKETSLTAKNLTVQDTKFNLNNLTAQISNNLTLANTTATASNNINLQGGNVSVVNGSTLATQYGNLSVQATLGSLQVANSSLTATQGNITLQAATNVSLTNAVVNATLGNLTAHAKGNLVTANATLAAGNNLTLSAGNLTLGKGTNVTSSHGNINLTATTGSLQATGANISASHGQLTLNATANVTLEHANLSAQTDLKVSGKNVSLTSSLINTSLGNLNLNATAGNLSVIKSTLVASQGNVTAQAQTDLSLSKTKVLVPKGNLSLESQGQLSVHNTTLTAGANLSLAASANLSINNSSLETKDNLSLTGANLTLSNGTNLTSLVGNINLTATQGSILAEGTNVTASQGKVALAAIANISLNNTNISGQQDIAVTAKNIALSNSKVNASVGNLTLNATLGNFTATKTTLSVLKGDLGLHAKANLSLETTQVAATKGNLTVNVEGNFNAIKSNLTAGSNLTTTAQGNFTAQDAQFKAGGNLTATSVGNFTVQNVTLQATANISLIGANLTLGQGTNVTSEQANIILSATQGRLQAEGSNVTATQGKIALSATENVSLNNTNIAAKLDLSITGKNVKVTSSQLNATAGNLTLHANAGNLTVAGSRVNAKGNLTAQAAKQVTLSKTNLSATANVAISGADVSLANGTFVTSEQGNIALHATQGSINAVGSNLTADNGKVALTATENVSLSNTNISSKLDLNVSGKNVSIADSKLNSKEGNLRLNATVGNLSVANTRATAKGNLTAQAAKELILSKANLSATANVAISGANVSLANGTFVTSEQETIALHATQGSINAVGSNLTADNGKVALTATENVSLSNTNISSKLDLNVSGKNVSIADSKLNSKEGNLRLNATVGNLSVANTRATAKGNLTAQAAKELTLSKANLSATSNVAISGANVSLANGTFVTSEQGKIAVNATQGSIQAIGSNLTANNGKVVLQAQENISLSNTNVAAKEDLQVTGKNVNLARAVFNTTIGNLILCATAGNLSVANSAVVALNGNIAASAKVNASFANSTFVAHGNITFQAANLTLSNGTNLTSQNGNLNLTATTGSLKAVGVNLTTNNGNVTLQAQTNLSLTNTNISTQYDVKVTGENLKLAQATLKAQEGDLAFQATKGNITVANSNFQAEKGNISIQAAANATFNNTSLTAHNNLTVTGANVSFEHGSKLTSAYGNLELNATSGNLNLENTAVEATKGNLTVLAIGNTSISNASLIANNSLTVKGANVSLANGTNLTSCHSSVAINATAGSITAQGANITATEGKVDLQAQENISLSNTNIAARSDLNFTARNIALQASKLNSTVGSIALNATLGNLSVANSTVIALQGSLTAQAKGNTNLSNSTFTANHAVKVEGVNVSLTQGVTLNSNNGDVELNATTASLVVSDATITALKGKLTATAQANTSLSNATLTANNDVKVVGANVSLTKGTKVSSSTANVELNATATNLVVEDSAVQAEQGSLTATSKGNAKLVNSTFIAKNALTVSGTNVTLANGTNLSSTASDVKVNATIGSLHATGVNITAVQGKVDLNAEQNISLTNTNIAARETLEIKAKNVTLEQTQVNSIHGNIALAATAGNLTIAKSKVVAVNGNLTATAVGNTTLSKALLTANGNLTLSGANLSLANGVNVESAQGNVKLNATSGNLTVSNSSISATKGNLTASAVGNSAINNATLKAASNLSIVGANVTLVNGTNISALNGNVKVNATTGSLQATGTNITASQGKVEVEAADNLSLNNTNISSQESLDVKAKNVTVTGSQVESTKGNISLAATAGNLTIVDSKVDAPKGNLSVSAVGNTTISNSALTAHGNLSVAGANVTLANGTNISALNGHVKVNATTGSLQATGTNITASQGKVEVEAADNLSLNNTNISSQESLDVKAKNVTVTGSQVESTKGNISLAATAGNLTIVDSKVDAPKGNLSVSAVGNTTISNSALTAHGNLSVAGANVTLANGTNISALNGHVKVNATTGSLQATGTNITASQGKVEVEAANNLSLNNTNISSQESLDVKAKNVTVTGSQVESTKGNISLAATAGNLTIADSKVEAPKGNLSVSAVGNTIISNSALTAHGNLSVAGANVTLANGTSITSTNGNVELNAIKGSIKADGSNVTAKNGKIELEATENISLSNANISAKSDVNVTGKNVGIVASSMKSIKGNITVNVSGGNLSLTNSTLNVPQGNLTAVATGNTTISNSSLTAKDTVTVKGANVTLANGTNISALNGNVKVNATTGSLQSTGANITASHGKAEIQAANNISLNNTNISAQESLDVKAKNVDVIGSQVESTKGNISLVATAGNLTVVNSKVETPNGNLSASALGNTKISNSALTAHGNLSITGANVTLGNGTNLSSVTGNIKLNATTGSLKAKGVNITANNGKVNVAAHENISLVNTNVSARDSVGVKAKNVELESSQVKSTHGNLALNATTGNLTVAKSEIAAATGNLTAVAAAASRFSSVHLTAQDNITVAGSELSLTKGSKVNTTQGNLTLNAMYGNLTVADTTLTAQQGNLSVVAQGNTAISNSTLNVQQNLTIKGANVTLNNGTNLSATNGNLELTATSGSLQAKGVNITANNGKVNFIAHENISLANTNVSAKQALEVKAKNVALNDSQLKSTEGNLSLVATHGNLTIANSVVIAPQGNITAQAAANTVISNSTLKANNLSLSGANLTLANGTNISAVNGDVTLHATAGSLTAKGVNITAPNGLVAMQASENISLHNTNITAKADIKVTGKNVDITNSPIATTQGNLALTATEGNLSLSNATLKAKQGNLTAIATGNTLVSNTTLKAQGNLTIQGANVTLNQGTNITSVTGNIITKATTGSLQANSVNISAKQGEVVLQATQNVSLSNTNVTAQKDVLVSGANVEMHNSPVKTEEGNITLTATKGNLSLVNTSLVAPQGNLIATATANTYLVNSTLEAAKQIKVSGANVTLANGTTIGSTNGNVALAAIKGSLTAIGSNVSANHGKVALQVQENISLSNTNISAKESLALEAKNIALSKSQVKSNEGNVSFAVDGNLTIANSSLKVPKGNLSATAKGNTVISNSSITAKENITLAGSNLSLSNGTKVDSTLGNIQAAATTGSISMVDTNLTASQGAVVFHAKENISLSNTNVSAKESLTFAAKNVILEQAQVKSTDGDLTLQANAGNLTVANSQLTTPKGNLTAQATGNTNVANSSLIANINLTIQGANLTLNSGTKLQANNGDLTLTATAGSLKAVDTNISAEQGLVKLSATTNVSLNNTNLSAYQDVVVTGKNVDLAHSKVLSAEGNLELTATHGNLAVESSSVEATIGNVGVKAKGNLSISNSQFNAPQGCITVQAEDKLAIANSSLSAAKNVNITGENLTLSNGSKVISQQADVTLTATTGSLQATGANITASQGKVALRATEIITLSNTNVTAKTDITVTGKEVIVAHSPVKTTAGNITFKATDGGLTLTNSEVLAPQGNIAAIASGATSISNSILTTKKQLTVQGKAVTLNSGTNLTVSEGNVKVTATDGAIKADGSNITVPKGSVDIAATGTVTLSNTNVSAQKYVNVVTKDVTVLSSLVKTVVGNITFHATEGDLTLTNSEVLAPQGNIAAIAIGATSFSNSTLTAEEQLTVQGKAVTLKQGTNLTVSEGDVKVTATDGEIKAVGTNITVPKGLVSVSATEEVTLSNTNVSSSKDVSVVGKSITAREVVLKSAKGNISLKAAEGSLVLTKSQIKAPQGKLDLKVRDNLTINSSQVETGEAITALAQNGNLSLAQSSLNTKDALTLQAKQDVALDKVEIKAQGKIDVTANKGKLAINHSDVVSEQKITLTGAAVDIQSSEVIESGLRVTIRSSKVHISDDSNVTGWGQQLQDTVQAPPMSVSSVETLQGDKVDLKATKEETTTDIGRVVGNTQLTSDGTESQIVEKSYGLQAGEVISVSKDEDAAVASLTLTAVKVVKDSSGTENKTSSQEVAQNTVVTQETAQETTQEVHKETTTTAAPQTVAKVAITYNKLGLCSLDVELMAQKYSVTQEDLNSLAANDIVQKYGMRSEDAQRFMQSCNLDNQPQNIVESEHSNKRR